MGEVLKREYVTNYTAGFVFVKLAVLIVLGGVWILGHYAQLAPTAYRDMFISITIPFVACAAVYYVIFFRQIRKANEMIEKLSEE